MKPRIRIKTSFFILLSQNFVLAPNVGSAVNSGQHRTFRTEGTEYKINFCLATGLGITEQGGKYAFFSV